MNQASEVWTTCAERLQVELSETVWDSTFQHLEPMHIRDDVLVLGVPSAIFRTRFQHRYLGLVCDTLHEMGSDISDIELVVNEPPPAAITNTVGHEPTPAEQPDRQGSDEMALHGLAEGYTFENA